MSTVAELQSAVRQLPRPEAWQFKTWLDERMADDWDRQIEADAQAGKLDPLWQKALTDIQAGRTHPLDEVLHDQ